MGGSDALVCRRLLASGLPPTASMSRDRGGAAACGLISPHKSDNRPGMMAPLGRAGEAVDGERGCASLSS